MIIWSFFFFVFEANKHIFQKTLRILFLFLLLLKLHPYYSKGADRGRLVSLTTRGSLRVHVQVHVNRRQLERILVLEEI